MRFADCLQHAGRVPDSLATAFAQSGRLAQSGQLESDGPSSKRRKLTSAPQSLRCVNGASENRVPNGYIALARFDLNLVCRLPQWLTMYRTMRARLTWQSLSEIRPRKPSFGGTYRWSIDVITLASCRPSECWKLATFGQLDSRVGLVWLFQARDSYTGAARDCVQRVFN